MLDELSGRQKGGLVVIAMLVTLAGGYWIGISSKGRQLEPLETTPLKYGEGPSQTSSSQPIEQEFIRISVKGAVSNPGLYDLPDGSRVEHAIEAAGGTQEGANLMEINLARKLKDGEEVFVDFVKIEKSENDIQWPLAINEATMEELELIPGIGPAMATDIVRWRSEVGPIEGVQDLERIPGFGPEIVRRILPYIRFN